MRFNFEAYEKVFPEKVEDTSPIESAVDTFKPTEAEKATDNKPGDDVMKAVTEDDTKDAPKDAEGEKDYVERNTDL